jgi:hypothetical protein
MSRAPSASRSPSATEKAPRPFKGRLLVSPKVPSPAPRRTEASETGELSEFTAAMSSTPSAFRSPSARASGRNPVSWLLTCEVARE